MERVEKYKKYFMAQANGKLPNQIGGNFGTLLTLDKAMDWVNKFCNVASHAAQVVSPVQQVTEQVKSELMHETSIKKPDTQETRHKGKRRRSNKSNASQAHKLVKRFKKE